MTISLVHASSLGTVSIAALLALGGTSPAVAQTGGPSIAWNMALDQPTDWYASAEAVRIAGNVMLYQHDNGGWPKNIDVARALNEQERSRIRDERAKGESTLHQTTLDNGATYSQMRYLARVHDETGHELFKESFLRGVDYLLAAQYETGGWPQYYPIREGYYEHITFNDDAMIGVMRLLRDVAQGRPPYSFVDPDRRGRAAAAIEKGLDVILKTQVVVGEKLTAWCAQHDRNDFTPQQARSYELPSLSGGESVEIIRYLMEFENPSPAVVRAVHSAVQWLDEVKLTGIAVIEPQDASLPRGFDRVVISDPLAPPLWARFYEIGTNRPMFVGRDGVVRYSLQEIEHERRIGYRWLADWARDLLATEYPAWRAALDD